MPITIKTNSHAYRDENGEYHSYDMVSDKTTADRVAEINQAANVQKTAIQQKGVETLATIPEDYTTLSNSVDELKSDLSAITKSAESVNVIKTQESVVTVGSASSRIIFPIYLKPNTNYLLRHTTGSATGLATITAQGVTTDNNYLIMIANYVSIDINRGAEFSTPADFTEGWYQLYMRFSPAFTADSAVAKNWICAYADYGVIPYSDYAEGVNLKNGIVETDSIDSKAVNLEKIADDVKNTFVATENSNNIFDKKDLVIDHILVTSDGKTDVASAGNAYTATYIPVANKVVWANYPCIVYGYDSNKNFLATRYIQQRFKACNAFDNSLAYVRIAVQNNLYNNDVIVTDGNNPAPYVGHKVIPNNLMPIAKTWYYGKKVATLGDSITAMETWQPHLKNALGITYTNCGIGGTLVCGVSANAMWQDVRINSIPTDSDVVIVMGGSNDWVSEKSLGNINSTDVTVFYGAYKTMLDKIYDRVPNAKVILMCPTHHTEELTLHNNLTL